MRRFLLAMIILMMLFNWTSPAFGEVVILEKRRLGNSTVHKWRCQEEGDLKVSAVPGFLRIVVSDAPPQEIQHLPVKDISQIDQYEDGVYIRGLTVLMEDENRYMPVFVYIPKEIKKPQEVIRTIKEARVGE